MTSSAPNTGLLPPASSLSPVLDALPASTSQCRQSPSQSSSSQQRPSCPSDLRRIADGIGVSQALAEDEGADELGNSKVFQNSPTSSHSPLSSLSSIISVVERPASPASPFSSPESLPPVPMPPPEGIMAEIVVESNSDPAPARPSSPDPSFFRPPPYPSQIGLLVFALDRILPANPVSREPVRVMGFGSPEEDSEVPGSYSLLRQPSSKISIAAYEYHRSGW